MYKFLLLLCFLIAASCAYGQTDSLTREEKRLLDSMFKNDEFIKLFTKRNVSYVDVNVGAGNRTFSLKNNALNAGQAQTNKIFYSPSVGYYHKSGLALTLSGFLATDNGNLKMYQYAINPSYTYQNKNIEAGVSYTRYIEGSGASFAVSPFTNDFYASAVYKKTWIEPGIAVGYSFGKQVEYYDTIITPQPPAQPRRVRDTITTKLSGLSLSLTASHTWEFLELINKKDALEIKPTLMLNAGSQRWDISHSNKLLNRFPRIGNAIKKRFGSGSGSEDFNLQSFAFLAELTYYYGKFYLQPQIYLDYYLPTTTEKRLTSLFSVTAGFSFY
jgi:hypothetical protein